MKLNLCGPIMEGAPHITGYGSHVRNLALALIKQGVDVGIEAFIDPRFFSLYEPELVKAMRKNYYDEVSLVISRVDNWEIKLADRPKKFFGYLVFEGTQIPYCWSYTICKHAKNIDGVIVPSNHVLEAVENGIIGMKNLSGAFPIHVVPEGVNTELFKPIKKRKDYFEFLFVGGWAKGPRDRKGLDLALKAYTEEFKPKEKVVFSVKINTAYAKKEKIIQDLQAIGITEFNPNLPKIRFNFDTLPDELLAKLYQQASAFVMPTKAEGFGLTIAEAMASGLPVLATDYGGHLDYFDDKVGYPIKVEKMIPATGEEFLYREAEWALPSVEHLSEMMRYVFDNQAEARAKGRKAVKNMQKFTWHDSAKKIIKLCFQ